MEAKGLYVGHDLDNLRATELRLGLPGTEGEPQKPSPTAAASRGSKRALAVSEEESKPGSDCTEGAAGSKNGQETAAGSKNGQEAAAPAAKAQVVGWPPIQSYRKNCLPAKEEAEASVHYVKVSMDGAPYLRKIDLKSYKGYKVLREAMEGMFKGFSTTEGGHGSSEYVITYEDKDGDWMLAGDVPWEMFTSSCRRMRIMRGSEARGLRSPTP